MKKLTLFSLFFGLIALVTPLNSQAQSTKGHDALKKHINSIVENVENTNDPVQKREVLNESLNDLITALDKVSERSISGTDKKAIADFKDNLQEKKKELNGLDGYAKVPNSQLNNYANFIQQDLEQADTVVTLSLTTVLLIVIILLLL